MRLRVEATEDELFEKSDQFIAELAKHLFYVNPDLSDILEKAIRSKYQKEPHYKVLKEIEKETGNLYEKQVKAMLVDIGKVLDRSVVK